MHLAGIPREKEQAGLVTAASGTRIRVTLGITIIYQCSSIMVQSLFKPDEILTYRLNHESPVKYVFWNFVCTLMSSLIPSLVNLFYIKLILSYYDDHYVQILCRLFIFRHVFLQLIPHCFAIAAASNAEYEFSMEFLNISFLELSHYAIMCLCYQFLIWIIVIILIMEEFVDIKAEEKEFIWNLDNCGVLEKISVNLLEIEENDFPLVNDYLFLQLMTEPILYCFTEGCLLFLISENEVSKAAILGLIKAMVDFILFYLSFLVASTSSKEKIFCYLAYTQELSNLLFALIFIISMTLDRESYIFCKIAKKYLFPVNIITLQTIVLKSIMPLISSLMPYLMIFILLGYCKFDNMNQADQELTSLLIIILYCNAYSQIIEQLVLSVQVMHFYYYAKKMFTKARLIINSVTGIIVAFIATIIILIFFTDGSELDFLEFESVRNRNREIMLYSESLILYYCLFLFGCPFAQLSEYLSYHFGRSIWLTIKNISYAMSVVLVVLYCTKYQESVDYQFFYVFLSSTSTLIGMVFYIIFELRDFYLTQKYGDYDKLSPFSVE